MIELCTTQGTPEWHKARHGRITASCAAIAIGGKHTLQRRDYIAKLADDMEGIPDFADMDSPPWFAEGRYYESWARGWYSFKYDVDVKETGFVIHDEYSWLGCSPDGLVGADGGVEIKYRKFLRTFKKHAAVRANAPVIAQIQMSMFVTGRQWWDYVNYWRDDANELEKGACERIERDDAYITNELLPAFVSLYKDVQTLLTERGVS